MREVHTSVVCDAGQLDARRAPRDDLLVREVVVHEDRGSCRMECAHGPFRRYERQLSWRPERGDPDRFVVDQHVRYRLAIPYWSGLYDPLVRRALPDGTPPGVTPWWCTPDRLSAAQATMVAAMAVFNLVAGLLYGLLTQVLTFVSADLGNGSADEQATIFAVSRVGVVLTFVAMVFADRVGRRRIALGSFVAAGALTVAAAFSPTLWVLAGLQLVSRNLAITGLLCVDTIAVEELPPGSRAMVTGLGALAYGLGAGIVVAALPLADVGPWGWRLTFGVGALALVVIWRAARHLPESERFNTMKAAGATQATGRIADEATDEATDGSTEELAASPDSSEHDPTSGPHSPAAEPAESDTAGSEPAESDTAEEPAPERRRIRGGRFVLLAAMFFLFNLFVAPASQLQNDYLRAELGYTGLLIAVFTIATGTPAGLGVLAGGRLADVRGRRAAIIPGMVAAGVFTALFFSTTGSLMWLAALLAGVFGTLAVPAMGVIAPELFPTARRGGARGALTAIAVVGSVVGLLTAGQLIESRSYAMAFTVLAIAPMVAALFSLAVPETRGRELEDLNR